ncbi:MAG: flippase-like domain-containing protein [Nitrospira sp.]|nr:flippase-like domain-containing protein [Nitrospira sp.]
MPRRVFFSLLFGILISAACLWYAFRGVDLTAMAAGISRIGIFWVLASLFAAMLSLIIRAVRWRFLLIEGNRVGIRSLLSATFIGFMANSLLPARLGEVVRAWVLARREHTPMPTALASVVVERLFDVIAALAFLGVGLAVVPDLETGASSLLKRSGLIILVIVVVGIGGLVSAVLFRTGLLRAAEQWMAKSRNPWSARGLELLHRFLEGLCGLRSGWQWAVVSALSILVWVSAIASFQVLADGFALGLTSVQTTLVFLIVLFGVAIPSAPGFAGTFHGFCVAGLALVAGTEPTRAAAFATLLHGTQWLTTIAIGLGCLWADRSLTWSGMMGLARDER